jgi:hypothetical protein
LKRISHPSFGTLYERAGKEHHHHFHCRECNRAFELPGCALKEDEAAPDGFVVEDHEVFLFGVCPSCVAVTRSHVNASHTYPGLKYERSAQQMENRGDCTDFR